LRSYPIPLKNGSGAHQGSRQIVCLESAIRSVESGDYRKAEALLKKGLGILGARKSPPTPGHLQFWNQLGMVYKYLGNHAKAARYYRLALQHVSSCFTGAYRDLFLADLFHNLGGLEHSRRHFRRGEKFTRTALRLRIRAAGAASLGAASDMCALAALLDGQGKFGESKPLYRKALRIYRREYGANHAEIAVVMNNLAALFQAQGHSLQAEKYYRAALSMKRHVLGKSHPDVGITLNNLAILYRDLGKKRQALADFQGALRILEHSLGRAHPSTRAVRNNYHNFIRSRFSAR
jgi:tetratricopeptide (TPR) repeat protein